MFRVARIPECRTSLCIEAGLSSTGYDSTGQDSKGRNCSKAQIHKLRNNSVALSRRASAGDRIRQIGSATVPRTQKSGEGPKVASII